MREKVMKIQRMFSNVGEEKLYSTGNDKIDDLLERAFCEGYEYAQREFGRTGKTKEQNKQFFTKVVDRKARRAENRRRAIEEGFKPSSDSFAADETRNGEFLGFDEQKETLRNDRSQRKNVETVEKDIKRASKNTTTKNITLSGKKVGKEIESTGTKEQLKNEVSSRNILRTGRKASRDTKYGKERWKGLNSRINRGAAGTRDLDPFAREELREKVREKKKLAKEANKLGKKSKVALGVGLGAAAIGTGIAIKKHKDKKREEDK